MATTAASLNPGFDLHANEQGRIRAASIVLIILPTIFVTLRLISRRISKAGYWWDDFWIIIALLLSYALPILSIKGLSTGFGRHIYLLSFPDTTTFLKELYIFEIFFCLTTACSQLSILAFYRRIFPIAQLRIVLIVVTAIILCFTLASTLVIIFQCVPVLAFWEVQHRFTATCLDSNSVILVIGSVFCALDAIIIFTPIPLLWRLRTTKSQKFMLTSIFWVAGFVCICSITKLVVLSRFEAIDVTWNFINVAIWSVTESSMAVVCACIPSLRPLFKRLVSDTYHGPTRKESRSEDSNDCGSNVSSRFIWKPSKDASVDSESRTFSRMNEMGIEPNTNWGFNVSVHGGRGKHTDHESQIDVEDMETPEARIMVKTEVTLISAERMEYHDQLF